MKLPTLTSATFNITLLILLTASFVNTGTAYGDSARFTKYDASGTALPENAPEWSTVLDSTTGLYWEVKKADDSAQGNGQIYKFTAARKTFVKSLNDAKFGGFSDWRLPTSDELTSLVIKGASEPFIDTTFFPNTQPSLYLSWRICGTGEIVSEKIAFGTEKVKGKSRYVRAVRGKEPPN